MILIIMFLFISCKRENGLKNAISISQITGNYDSLIYNVKIKGDTNAYDELFYGFIDANKIESTDSVMAYSKIMAETYNCEKAYFDYFTALCEKNGFDVDYSDFSQINIQNMSEPSRKKAISWLKKMLKNNVITEDQYKSVRK